MQEKIIIKELSLNDIDDNLLDFYDRYQKVEKYWTNKNGSWTLIDEGYTEDWDKERKVAKIQMFKNILSGQTGFIYGVYDDNKLIGFTVLLNQKFGSNNQYIQLKQLHVSNGYRHKGIGKKLFGLCIEKAMELKAEKIYISANDSEDTQKFYLGIGCKDAMEIDAKSAEAEPYDRQMEYVVNCQPPVAGG